jgi:hypothetical protein
VTTTAIVTAIATGTATTASLRVPARLFIPSEGNERAPSEVRERGIGLRFSLKLSKYSGTEAHRTFELDLRPPVHTHLMLAPGLDNLPVRSSLSPQKPLAAVPQGRGSTSDKVYYVN